VVIGSMFKESLINSVYCANGIFFRPAASENLVHSAAISAVSFLAGQKIHSLSQSPHLISGSLILVFRSPVFRAAFENT